MYFPRLRDLREDKDMNQTQIAKLLFTSQTVYSRYERGVLTIPVEHLLILADFYGVSTDYILGRTNNKKLNKYQTLPYKRQGLAYIWVYYFSSDLPWIASNFSVLALSFFSA